MFEKGGSPKQIVKEQGLEQVTDIAEIEKIIDNIIASNQDKVAEYKAGKDKLFGFFVGQAMKDTEGKASPAIVNELLRKKLG
jgi:aspartyl-tRNA(Asn)/glutamyl-tRNA(Gln) amidotransferase subunit B